MVRFDPKYKKSTSCQVETVMLLSAMSLIEQSTEVWITII